MEGERSFFLLLVTVCFDRKSPLWMTGSSFTYHFLPRVSLHSNHNNISRLHWRHLFAASPLVPLPFMFSSSPSRLRESTTYSPVRQSIEDDVNVITIPTPKQHGFLLSAQASNCRSAGRPASVHVFKFAMSHSCRNRAASETKYPAPGAECRLGSKDGHQVQLHSGMQHSWPRPYFSPPGTSPCS